MFGRPFAFVSEPANFNWEQAALWRASPFAGFAVLQQNGPDRVNVDAGVRFRDRARQEGFKAAQWVNLETPDALDHLPSAGRVAAAVAPGWDGTVVDAELIVPPEDTGPFLREFRPPKGHPFALSTVPTFPFGTNAAEWDRRRAWLCQQCYVIENGVSCAAGRAWALDKPPLYVGWHYRANVQGRGRRFVLDAVLAGGVYRARGIGGPFLVHPGTRTLRRTLNGPTVGKLEGLWHPARWAPTFRTTPNGLVVLDPEAAMADVRLAGSPPASAYLAETTPLEFLAAYRP